MITSHKGLLILALAIVAFSALFLNAYGTETRVGSMGGIGFYTHDNSNIFFFPGAIYSYGGQVVGEFRVKSVKNAYTVGVNYPIKDKWVVGAYLNRPVVVTIPVNLAANLPDDIMNALLDHTTDIFWGAPMANFDFGARLSIGLDSRTEDIVAGTTVTQEKQTAYYLNLGLGATTEKMDLGVNFELPHAKGEFDTLKNTWSGFGFGINARMFHGDKTKLVPLAVFSYRGTSAKFEPGTAKTDFKDFNLGLGLGVNHNINENNLLVMAVELFGLQSSKQTVHNGDETTNSIMTYPGLYMGLESNVKSWLDGRIGVSQVFQSNSVKVKPPTGSETKNTTRSAPYNVTFGLGIHFGEFLVDAGVNEGLFFDGPNFISGGVNPMAARLSATYQF